MPLPTTLSGTNIFQMWHFIHKVTQHSNVPESIYVLQALHVALDFLEMSPAHNWEVQLTQVMLPPLHLPQRHQPCRHCFHHSPSNGQRGRWWCSPRSAPGQRFATSQHAKPSSPTNDQNDVHILKDLYTGESDWLGGFCWVSFSSWNQVEWLVAGMVTIKAWKVWKNTWTKSRWEVEDWIWFQLLGAMEDFEGLARYWNGVHNGNYVT